MTPPSVEPSRVFRTPEHRFHNLPGLPYVPRYSHYGNLRYAYIDIEGPVLDLKTGSAVDESVHVAANITTETVLCLHGEPTWSYLYRKMIPGFLTAVAPRPYASEAQRYVQRRVVCPDFIGFGRSDKPLDDEYYTWDSHRGWLVHAVTELILNDARTRTGGRVTLAVQDWGGLLGLILPNLFPALFTHLIVMNTGLGTGKLPSQAWAMFRDYIARTPDVDCGALISRGTPLSKAEREAYNAPFVGQETKAAVRRFPQLVPVHPHMRGVADSVAAYAYYRSLPRIAYADNSLLRPSAPQSQGVDGVGLGSPLQVFVVCGCADPVLGEPVMRTLAERAFGESVGYWWHTIQDGGHFVQEWCEHVPALSDRAFTGRPQGTVSFDGESAEWHEPKISSKM